MQSKLVILVSGMTKPYAKVEFQTKVAYSMYEEIKDNNLIRSKFQPLQLQNNW